MKHFKTYLAAMALALSDARVQLIPVKLQELWYAQPAKVWMESLPIGNKAFGSYDLWWNRGETGIE